MSTASDTIHIDWNRPLAPTVKNYDDSFRTNGRLNRSNYQRAFGNDPERYLTPNEAEEIDKAAIEAADAWIERQGNRAPAECVPMQVLVMGIGNGREFPFVERLAEKLHMHGYQLRATVQDISVEGLFNLAQRLEKDKGFTEDHEVELPGPTAEEARKAKDGERGYYLGRLEHGNLQVDFLHSHPKDTLRHTYNLLPDVDMLLAHYGLFITNPSHDARHDTMAMLRQRVHGPAMLSAAATGLDDPEVHGIIDQRRAAGKYLPDGLQDEGTSLYSDQPDRLAAELKRGNIEYLRDKEAFKPFDLDELTTELQEAGWNVDREMVLTVDMPHAVASGRAAYRRDPITARLLTEAIPDVKDHSDAARAKRTQISHAVTHIGAVMHPNHQMSLAMESPSEGVER